MTDWMHDPVAATRYAQTHSYQKGLPPHWTRCDYVREGIRCAKAAGHENSTGAEAAHAEPKA